MIYLTAHGLLGTVKRKLVRAIELFSERGLGPLVSSAEEEVRYDLLRRADPISPEPIMDREWDNLVVLDACRYDSYAGRSPDHGELERITAPGGHSAEFVQQHFADTPHHETICLTANPWYIHYRDRLDLFKLVAFWNPDRSSEPHCSPSDLVDRAIETHREWPEKRLVIHMMQPHIPFLTREGGEIVVREGFEGYGRMIDAGHSTDEIRSAYETCLEVGLTQVTRFLDEVDGKSVVTADHGELLGEPIRWWRRRLHPDLPPHRRTEHGYSFFGHARTLREPALIDVPYHELPFDRRREITTGSPVPDEVHEGDVEEQLAALGYL